MSDLDDLLLASRNQWPTMTVDGPFKAVMPPESNGFCHVEDRAGNQIATCYSNGSMHATAIAYALNQVFPGGKLEAEPKV